MYRVFWVSQNGLFCGLTFKKLEIAQQYAKHRNQEHGGLRLYIGVPTCEE